MTIDPIALLVPRPRRCQPHDEPWSPPSELLVALPDGAVGNTLEGRLTHHLASLGRPWRRLPSGSRERAVIVLALDPSVASRAGGGACGDEAYQLEIAASGVRILAASQRGLGHGIATLGQWLRIHHATARARAQQGPLGAVPGLEVDDHPDLAVRGVMLDVSRNKVPRLDTLVGLAELLADLKINQLQLYLEHAFAYRGHEVVWRDADPLSGDDIEQLDRVCRDLGIELVPNQNSFGHFHRWLIHPRYRPLAECPEGIDHPFSDRPEPFSLCPLDPGAPDLLADLYDQLLPHFTSRKLNVGLDETLDLGLGRSARACAERGKGRVYLDFLHRVHRLVTDRGHRMLFWGDVILDHPAAIAELPTDAIALDWGYEADHPFDSEARRFAEAGLEFWLCPGTSSWNSFGGRHHNALHNLASAARAARQHGAGGLLITDWGDHGHLQPLPVSFPPLVAGAAFAWRCDSADDPNGLPLTQMLDVHVFDDPAAALGRAAVALGEVAQRLGAPPPGAKGINGSALFFQIILAGRPVTERRGQGMTRRHLAELRGHLEGIQTSLWAARPQAADGPLVVRELTWVSDILELARQLADQRLLHGEDRPLDQLPAVVCQSFDTTLAELVPRRHELWLARNRAGGWPLSRAKLEGLRRLLRADQGHP